MYFPFRSSSAVILCALASLALAQEHHHHPTGDPAELGEVSFPTSCEAAVQADFNRAVAMLHSFWYPAAEAAFRRVAEADPGCAMAHWGIAMTHFHQLWQSRSPTEGVAEGQAALQRAIAIGGMTPREQHYVAALQAYLEDPETLPFAARMKRYEDAMAALHGKYPDDAEGAIFYSLALLGMAYASPPDREFVRQRKAGEILESILTEQPTHPGVVHYIIHSYDYPPLAPNALDAARRYAEIAPAAPHALHMPSHIFTRLGLWDESIATNIKSAETARKDGWTREELHATDYLAYAYLQLAQDDEVAAILDALPGQMEQFKTSPGADASGYYAVAAIPARYALERRRWGEAASLPVDEAFFPPEGMCWAPATLYFARGLGAARTGDAAAAREAIGWLDRCHAELGTAQKSWAITVDVQRKAVGAWAALAEGRQDEALAMMADAADLEDATDKPPITPGATVPARELLGDMLMAVDRPADALAAYEAVLRDSPNRFQALFGAAQAAERGENRNAARGYYARLLRNAERGVKDRAEVRVARKYVQAELG